MTSSRVQSAPTSKPPIHTSSSRKRALDDALSSPYSKMRSTLKDLRPLFLQVIGAPDIQQSEAARGIQEKMKLMVDLCKQMAMEAPPVKKCNNGPGVETFASRNQDGHGEKLSEPCAVDEEFVKLGEEDGLALGTSVVGGSAFGWNFVMFISSKPKYYGRSKESFRAANPKLEAGEALNA